MVSTPRITDFRWALARWALTSGGRPVLGAVAGLARDVVDSALHHRQYLQSPGVGRTDFNPYSRRYILDPYPTYQKLLVGPPVHYNPRINLWIISRYDDARAALRANDLLSSADGIAPFRAPGVPMMVTTDEPDHMRLRKMVSKDFTRGELDKWKPAIQEHVDGLLDQMLGKPLADAVNDLAVPLPLGVLTRILGVPPEDESVFTEMSNDLFKVARMKLSFSFREYGPLLKAVPTLARLNRYFANQLEIKRNNPTGADLLTKLGTRAREETLTEDELFWFILMLLIAGIKTTTNLVGAMMLSLAEHPEQFQLLRQHPELIPSAIEEQLRYTSPAQGAFRTATAPYQVGEATIPKGARVVILEGAANRDPRKYPDPNTYDIQRNPSDNIAFGHGIHVCIGAYIARIEAQRVLEYLVENVAEIKLIGAPKWDEIPVARGLQYVPITLVPASDHQPAVSSPILATCGN